MRAAVIQMNCEPGNVDRNTNRARELVGQAAEAGAQWAVLPELFQTGYVLQGRDREFAGPVPGGQGSRWMVETAKAFQIMLTGCIIEEENGCIFDTAVMASPEGIQGIYRKVHLWGNERERFCPGAEIGRPVGWGRWTVGLQICYEAGFPEGARMQVLKGANVLAYMAAFGAARTGVWDLATRARALENGCYVVAADRCGTEPGQTEFAGQSRIVAPDGSVLAQVDSGEGIAVAELELSRVEQQRKAIPYLRDLRTGLIAAEWQDFLPGKE